MKNSYTKKNQREAAVKGIAYGTVYFFSEGENAKSVLEPLIAGARQVVVVIAAKAEEQLSRLESQEKIKVFSPEDKNGLRAYIAESPAEIWVPADRSLSWNISRSLQSIALKDGSYYDWYRAGCKSAQNNKLRSGPAAFLAKVMYKKVNALFSPSNEKYAEWKAFAVTKETLLALTDRFGWSSPGRMQNQCNLLELKPGSLELAYSQLPGYAGEIKKTFAEGVRDYFVWFFKDSRRVFLDPSKDRKDRIQGFSRFTFAVLFLACLVGMPVLSFDYGITWDEKLQYDFAKDIYKYLITFGADQSVFDYSKGLWQPMQYYGSFFDVLTVAFNDVFGIENEYEARHVLNSLFGVLGLLFAGLTARALTGSWLAALLAFLLLLLTPSYYGHSMNNPKDIPFAAGFFMAVYYMVRFLKELPQPSFATRFLFAAGAGLGISIRVGGILIFPYLILFMGIKWLGVWLRDGQGAAFKIFTPYLRHFLTVLVFGWMLGMIFWPFGLKDPINNPIIALKGLSNVNYSTSYETFEGVRTYMSELPWYYSLKLITIGMPLVVLAGLLVQLVHAAFGSRRDFWWNAMLVFMFLFPVLYAAYKESMLYNGWRHWFFVYGNIVILAAWGWSWLIENRKAALRYAGTALVTLGCANMVWWMVRSHPNQYVYFNELTGGLKGAYGYYETDYYSNTLKQAAEWLCENEDVDSRAITVVTNNEPLTAQYYVDKYSDSVGILWTREYELSKKYADYAFFTTRTMSKTTLHGGWFPPKGTIHTIEVDGVPLCAIVKRENQYAPQAYEFIEKGEKDSAAHYFQLAIDHDPLNEELYRMLGMVYLNMGPEYMDSGYLALKKSIELLPENFIAYDMLGMYYMKKNNLVEAEKNFSVSISYKINYTNAHYNRGIALFNSGNYIEAVREFEASVRYGGHKPEFYKLLGLSQMNLGQLDKAIQMLNNSISLNASDPEVFDYLGQAYERKGDAANSANAYGRAFQLRGGQN